MSSGGLTDKLHRLRDHAAKTREGAHKHAEHQGKLRDKQKNELSIQKQTLTKWR